MKLRFLLSTLIPLSLAFAGCGTDSNECDDGTDNDNDGLIDMVDPGCIFSGGGSEFPDPAACQDGKDNDGDGLIDLEDPGCALPTDNDESNPVVAQCTDGIDNDSDGLIDFPNDPGCALVLADSEVDSCPGDGCPACANGVDDDGDGKTDYPDDLGCNSASDSDEFNADPSVCGTNVSIQPLPADGQVSSSFTGAANNELISADCGGNGEEHVYIYTITEPKSVVITTDFAETAVDTVVYVRTDCRETGSEIACNDDSPSNTNSTLAIDLLDPGTYYIVVDRADGTDGDYRLSVDSFVPEKEPCDPTAMDCTPGLFCRLFTEGGVTATDETCEQPECSDGQDSDGDTFSDFPDEPGCSSPEDNDETDDCPDGVNCPACSNGIDDDADGVIDFANDPGCFSAADDLEEDCQDSDPIVAIGSVSPFNGTTAGATNDYTPSCQASTNLDVAHLLTIPVPLDTLTIDSEGSSFDTILTFNTPDCNEAAEVVCDDDGAAGTRSLLELTNVAPGNYFVMVDGFSESANGAYTLNFSGTITTGNTCDPSSTIFTCAAGSICNMNTCTPTTCNDGVDNDVDGLTDFPNDPGCDSIDDNDEADDCPDGINCPQCSNGIDDDADGLTDFGSDLGCISASDNLEIDECSAGVPFLTLTDNGVTGTTPPSADGSDTSPSCHNSTVSTEDEYGYKVTREFTSLSFSTVGSTGDTVLSVRRGTCDDVASEIACANDDPGESVTVADPVLDELLFVFVDGDFISAIDYVLNVSGTLPIAAACTVGDTQFTCDSALGLTCDAVSNTCVPTTCSDGVDNDVDGLVDLLDPGCSGILDDDESDDPVPPPLCADGIDNDADGEIDFPNDLGCTLAADDSELNCEDSDTIDVIAASMTMSTTTGLTDDFSPSCQGNSTSPDKVFELSFPGELESLTVDTEVAAFDTVIYMRAALCSTEDFVCDDDGGVTSLRSLFTVTDVPAGLYFIVVDAFSTNDGTFTLNLNGVIKAGEACDDAQITAGFLSCTAGTTCTAGTCQ